VYLRSVHGIHLGTAVQSQEFTGIVAHEGFTVLRTIRRVQANGLVGLRGA